MPSRARNPHPTPHAYYFFKVELPADGFEIRKAKTVAASQRWDMACYQIEKGLGIHNKMKQQKANCNNTHVVAYHYQEWLDAGKRHHQCTPLAEDTVLREGDKLVLFRVALPPNEPPRVPAELRRQEQQQEQQLHIQEQDARWQPLSEEERLQELLSADGRKHTFEGVFVGGTRQGGESTGPPPLGYICHRCRKPGHFKSKCPTLHDPNFVPLDNRRRTTGVPLSELRPARPDEHAWAWVHSDGRLMVPKV